MKNQHLALLAALTIICLIRETGSGLGQEPNVSSDMVTRTVAYVETSYIEDITKNSDWQLAKDRILGQHFADNQAAFNAIVTLLMSLNDTEVRILSPEQVAEVQGEVEGHSIGVGIVDFGIDTDPVTGEARLVTPIADSPAARAGLLPKDLLATIDGRATTGLPREATMGLLRGQSNTRVLVHASRGGKPVTLKLERQEISLDPVRLRIEKRGGRAIAYLRICQITSKAPEEARELALRARESRADSMVLDLRDNPGGVATGVAEIAGIFLKEKVAYSSIDKQGNIEKFVTSGPLLWDKPLAILIDAGTGSSAEDLAAAIRYNQRGFLVGENTFGRGRGLKIMTLPGHYVLVVPALKFITPRGQIYHGKGIPPDYPVGLPEPQKGSWTISMNGSGADVQYNKAVAILQSTK
ncbi:MAG: S41 family peptidase [Candidatus Binataceae bacterium]